MKQDSQRFTHTCAWLLALALAFSASCIHAKSPANEAAKEAPEPLEEPGITYEVDIQGVEEVLRQTLKAASVLEARKARPPDAMVVLRRLVERDIKNLLQAMRSAGYFGAVITPQIDDNAAPVRIVFNVQPGPRYLFESVEIEYVERPEIPSARLPTVDDLSLSLHTAARSEKVLASQGEILTLLKNRGFPYPDAPQPRVTVDHATRGVHVVYPVHMGPPAVFGETTIQGLEDVREDFIRGQIPWKEGQRFDERVLTELDDKLRDSGLFTVTSVATEEQLDPEGRVPIAVSVRERRPKTVKAGVSFQSDVGMGARASWQHRNLFGRGENLNIETLFSTEESAFDTVYTKPQFLRDNQTLRLEARVAEEDRDAFFSRSALLQASVERRLSKRLTLGTGLGFRATNVHQFDEETTHHLLFVPSFVTYDDSQGDALNPQSGGRLALRGTPFLDVSDANLHFLRGQVTYSHYLNVSETPRVVLAGRISLGAIAGADREEIPADERFYAGGGGSIRGYEFQMVGPLRDDTPLGGRSLLEFSLEARTRISERFGIVPFIDGGSVFESSYPKFDSSLRWGAGIGLRYFSPLGPVRVDLAVPVNRRSGIDEAFQIYISLGQAF